MKVTLLTGQQVDCASEAWRHECEARFVARLPSDERSSYLVGVEKRRGEAAGLELKQLAIQIYRSALAAPTEEAHL